MKARALNQNGLRKAPERRSLTPERVAELVAAHADRRIRETGLNGTATLIYNEGQVVKVRYEFYEDVSKLLEAM